MKFGEMLHDYALQKSARLSIIVIEVQSLEYAVQCCIHIAAAASYAVAKLPRINWTRVKLSSGDSIREHCLPISEISLTDGAIQLYWNVIRVRF